MKITDIRLRRIFSNSGALKAIMSVTMDDCLAIHDIKIIKTQDRLFVTMPSRKDHLGKFRDTVHPIDRETRAEMETAIINAYLDYLKAV